MKNYDCIIVGDDIYALLIALFLTRKMRDVLLISKSSPYKHNCESISIEFDKTKHHFEYDAQSILTGLSERGLTRAFLDDLNLLDDIQYMQLHDDHVITKEGKHKVRSSQVNDFKIFLQRYYPKQIKQIKRFFDDLDKHFSNYYEQYLNLLHNNDYTLTSLMVEWGDYSLKELLMLYFGDSPIIKEFTSNAFINGLDLEKVSAYSFMSNYFNGMYHGLFYIRTPHEQLKKAIIKRIKANSKQSIIKAEITNIVSSNNKITYIEDNKGNQFYAKYFYFSDQPIEFYNDYFKDSENHIQKLKQYYPNLDDDYVQRTIYFVFEVDTLSVGIDQLMYYYQDHENDSEKILRITNYNLLENNQSPYGKICVDIAYHSKKGFSEQNILDKLFIAFPKLKWINYEHVYGNEFPYLSMLRVKKLRGKMSIGDLIDFESLNHVNIFDNLFIGGGFIRPESSYYGKIHQSIVTADKIEDGLYFKDEVQDYYYSNDEVMMILRQNYDDSYFGKREVHINFQIGKSNYFFRIKGKNIVVHRGRYKYPELSIYTSSDRLTDLVFKRNTYQDTINSSFFKYNGSQDTFVTFLKAFDLDDRNPVEPVHLIASPFKKFGFYYFNLLMFVIGMAAFLLHFVQGIYIYFPLLMVLLTLNIYKYLKLKIYNYYEISIICIVFVLGVLSIFIREINFFKQDHILIAPVVFLLLLSVFSNKPLVKDVLQYDYSLEFVKTKLFLSISNGITFVWAFIFLSIVFGPFFAGERHISVLYYMIFLGFAITYYYPSIYVRTSIKKS